MQALQQELAARLRGSGARIGGFTGRILGQQAGQLLGVSSPMPIADAELGAELGQAVGQRLGQRLDCSASMMNRRVKHILPKAQLSTVRKTNLLNVYQ